MHVIDFSNEKKDEVISTNIIQDTEISEQDIEVIEKLNLFINVYDKNVLDNLGIELQKKNVEYADLILKSNTFEKMSESDKLLTFALEELITYGKFFDKNASKRVLQTKKKYLKNFQEKYKNVEEVISDFENKLKEKQKEQKEHCSIYKKMNIHNIENYKSIKLIIMACNSILSREKDVLAKFEAREDLNQFLILEKKELIDKIEAKIEELSLTEGIIVTQIMQLKSMIKSVEQLDCKFNSILNTIMPMWRINIASGIGMNYIIDNCKMIEDVQEATNGMLIGNSLLNKHMSTYTAKVSNTGIIEVETLKEVNQNLVNALMEAQRIVEGIMVNEKNDDIDKVK